MNIEPVTGPMARAIEASKTMPRFASEERHHLRYCGYCFRSFGIDVVTAMECSCGKYNMHDAGGTMWELGLLETELKAERISYGIDKESA